MNNKWDKILLELSYRVSSGIPDLSNEQHLMKLWDILKEHNWNIDARVELLKNLDEQVKKRYYQTDKGQKAPEGAKVGVGPEGGTYYWSNPDGSAADEKDIPKEKPQDDFERPELTEEQKVEARQTQSKECDMWLNFDKKEGAKAFKDETKDMSEEEKGAAGSAQSKCGEAVTVQGATRVKELMSEGKSFDEAIKIVEKEIELLKVQIEEIKVKSSNPLAN